MVRGISRQSIAALLFIAWSVQAAETDQQLVMSHITADSLRGNLSFIASDTLEGRATPSPGLDLAAEYIAAQFRRAGLEPAGDDGYFQTATLLTGGVAHNVAGILRGSDPALRDTYVLLTAHYDHVGTTPNGDDHIFNGANDDGSGTVSVIEIAQALAALPVRPARSILFMTFYGEERGLWGSRFYAQHPLVPIEKTIADLNLEQVGRTDATNGPQLKNASITGYDFSDLPKILAEAARPAGVKVYKDDRASDAYFSRSDNRPLADLGIPSHTLCVAFDFPDYHKVTDSWDKIDYANMATVDSAVALGLLRLASSAPPPQWNDSYPPAQRYVDAAKHLHP